MSSVLISRNDSSMEYTSVRGVMRVRRLVMRRDRSPYSSKLAENCTTPCVLKNGRHWKAGAPMGMPSAFASLLRATTHPSLLLSTTTGLPSRSGLNTRSQLTKKLLQSMRAKVVGLLFIILYGGRFCRCAARHTPRAFAILLLFLV